MAHLRTFLRTGTLCSLLLAGSGWSAEPLHPVTETTVVMRQEPHSYDFSTKCYEVEFNVHVLGEHYHAHGGIGQRTVALTITGDEGTRKSLTGKFDATKVQLSYGDAAPGARRYTIDGTMTETPSGLVANLTYHFGYLHLPLHVVLTPAPGAEQHHLRLRFLLVGTIRTTVTMKEEVLPSLLPPNPVLGQ